MEKQLFLQVLQLDKTDDLTGRNLSIPTNFPENRRKV